jgi:hypothetical protein
MKILDLNNIVGFILRITGIIIILSSRKLPAGLQKRYVNQG